MSCSRGSLLPRIHVETPQETGAADTEMNEQETNLRSLGIGLS